MPSKKNDILITVAVIAYNSSETILDTLESIRKQTYPQSCIELLIADDCSKDNTLEITEAWLKKYGSEFESVQILHSPTNQGISHNTNQALHAARGEYYKGIAADDVLMESCISEYVGYMNSHPNVDVLFARVLPFGTKDIEYLQKMKDQLDESFFKKTKDEQLRYLLLNRNCLPAPTSFIKMQFLREHNIECDERIPMIEDYPLWINMLRAHAKFACLDIETVLYRADGITSSCSEKFFRSGELLVFYYRYQAWLQDNEDEAIQLVVNRECELFQEIERLKATKAYRLGKLIICPFSYFKKLYSKKKS